MRAILVSLGILLIAYLAVVALVFAKQRSLLYFPSHTGAFRVLRPWTVRGETIGYARQIMNPSSVWLMAHGNAGEAAHRDYILECLPPNSAVYVVEYPGYGLRSGLPTEASLNRAVREAYDELVSKYPSTGVAVIGESLGSGPACRLAGAPIPPSRFVLIVPFDTLLSVASDHMPLLPASLLLRDRWDNVDALRNYPGPVTVYGAESDTIIRFEHARRLAMSIGATFHLLKCGHNDWSSLVRIE
jgi:pimeloyl-ACP methyl ester carboxylesterase